MKRNTSVNNLLKWIVVLLLISKILPAGAQKTEDLKITGDFREKPLMDFLGYLSDQHKIRVFSKVGWIDSCIIHNEFKDIGLIKALEKVFEESQLTYRIFQEDALFIFPRQNRTKNSAGMYEDLILVIGDPMNVGRFRKAVVTGKIVDGKSGEALPGAVVINTRTGKGTTTDMNGGFELEMPTGENTLKFTYMGFQPLIQKIRLIESGSADFELFEETHNLGEVTVVGDEINSSRTQMSMLKINAQSIKKLPVLMGETDVIKSIASMPGVQTVGELSSGFNVRGGNTDQNLSLLDGTPVFNTSHIFGFLSMINPDLLTDVKLYKGGIPAKYGERVSSVMEIGLKEGNKKTVKVYGGLGLINSRLTAEGPVTKDKKLTFIVGGRTSYTNWILKKIPEENISQSVTNFYDASGKVTYAFDLHNSISLMTYTSNDEFSTSAQSVNKYGNMLLNLRLNNKLTDNLNGELNLSYSKYAFRLTDLADSNLVEAYYLQNKIQYNAIKYHFIWQPHERHNVQFGLNGIWYLSDPGKITPYNSVSLIGQHELDRERAYEAALYLGDEFDITPNLTMNLGLRYSRYGLFGPSTVFLYDKNQARTPDSVVDSLHFNRNQIVKRYGGIEPRISFNYIIDDGYSLKVSCQRIRQYFNQVSNNAVISPAETWKASDYYLKPLINDQLAVGLTTSSLLKGYNLSAEMYYKNLQNLIEYKNGAQLVMNSNLETDLISADGYSYGIEFSLNKSQGRLTGWLNYTYSKTLRKTTGEFESEQINDGKYYPSIYDKPHDLSVVATYNISRRWRVSGNFVYVSGRPVTLPELTYRYAGQKLVYYSERNKYRMPPYHRLDMAITFDENLRRKRMWKGSWTFSVYNVYGRNNPYSIYYKKSTSGGNIGRTAYSLFKLYIIGIPVPSLTYNFTF